MKNAFAERQGAQGHRSPTVNISAVAELTAGRDEQVGQIFRNMRSALKVPREILARRLATTPSVIDSFEAGALTALPNWKETERIVRSYCDLLRFDPEPVLWRLRSQLQAVANNARPVSRMPLAKSDAQSPHASRERITDTPLERTRPRRRKARVGVLFVLSVPIALAGAVVYVEQVAPKPVHRAIGFLPATLASPVRAGLQYLAGWATAGGDGLRWIEVGDPRSRKADKLPTRVQQ